VFKVQLLHRNVQRFRRGLVFKAHRLCVLLNSWLESDKEEKKRDLKSEKAHGGGFEVLGLLWVALDHLCGSEEGSYLRLIDFCITRL